MRIEYGQEVLLRRVVRDVTKHIRVGKGGRRKLHNPQESLQVRVTVKLFMYVS